MDCLLHSQHDQSQSSSSVHPAIPLFMHVIFKWLVQTDIQRLKYRSQTTQYNSLSNPASHFLLLGWWFHDYANKFYTYDSRYELLESKIFYQT
jgi:hypothetical protein